MLHFFIPEAPQINLNFGASHRVHIFSANIKKKRESQSFPSWRFWWGVKQHDGIFMDEVLPTPSSSPVINCRSNLNRAWKALCSSEFSLCSVHQNKRFWRESSSPFIYWDEGSNNWDQAQALQSKTFNPCHQTVPKHLRMGHKSSFYSIFLAILAVNDPLSVKQHPSEQDIQRCGQN